MGPTGPMFRVLDRQMLLLFHNFRPMSVSFFSFIRLPFPTFSFLLNLDTHTSQEKGPESRFGTEQEKTRLRGPRVKCRGSSFLRLSCAQGVCANPRGDESTQSKRPQVRVNFGFSVEDRRTRSHHRTLLVIFIASNDLKDIDSA